MVWKEFVNTIPLYTFIDDGFALMEITSSKDIFHDNIKDVHCQLFVTNGSLSIKIENVEYSLTKNAFADIVGKNSMSFLSCSDDIHAWCLIFTEAFMFNLLKNNPPFPINYIMDRHYRPMFYVCQKTMRLFCERINRIEKEFENTEHVFRSRMIAFSFFILIMDIANVFFQQDKQDTNKESDHCRLLFMKFMILLRDNIEKEHTVAFYASQMCITPQYLARIVKKCSGSTVYAFITKGLIGHLLKELRETDKTISQIAQQYEFADLASFTKFFSRQMKMTPSEYRNKNA